MRAEGLSLYTESPLYFPQNFISAYTDHCIVCITVFSLYDYTNIKNDCLLTVFTFLISVEPRPGINYFLSCGQGGLLSLYLY